MSEKTNTSSTRVQQVSYLKPILTGAGIALTLIVIFLSGVNNPDPSWPKFWMAKPLIIVPLAGAMGGLFYYLVQPLHFKAPWKKVAAVIVCLVVYIIGLWLGTVLGLDGTLWD